MTIRQILAVALVMSATPAHAGSSWDGTWSGTLNNEPVSFFFFFFLRSLSSLPGLPAAPFQFDRPSYRMNYQGRLSERTRRGSWPARRGCDMAHEAVAIVIFPVCSLPCRRD